MLPLEGCRLSLLLCFMLSEPEPTEPVPDLVNLTIPASADGELLQLAIERSLDEGHQSDATVLPDAPPTRDIQPIRAARNAQHQNAPAVRRNSTSQNPPVPEVAHYSSHNPPSEKPPDPKTFEGTISHFISAAGKRMVTYRRVDDTIAYIGPEPNQDEEPIFMAIREGDAAQVKNLAFQPGTNLMQPSKPGWLPIHQAAWYKQTECLRALVSVQHGMLNKQSARGETALLVAVQRDSLDCALVLLENGANPDIPNFDKETPLFKACEFHNAAMVAAILNHGAAVNKHCIQGCTALQEATVHNDVEIFQMLISAGAKINTPNMFGITPLFSAAQNGCMDTLRLVIKHGGDINTQATDGNTALYEAVKEGQEEAVELLLSHKADANKPGRTGLLPLHMAAKNGNEAMASLLIPKTSRTCVRRSGISPLHFAAERNRDEVLEMLLKAGYEVNALLSDERSTLYEDRRRSVLYFSVANVNIHAVRLLLSHGAKTDLDTLPPLAVAARQGALQTVNLLLEHGAQVNVSVPGLTTSFPPLIMFTARDPLLLKVLLDHGLQGAPCFTCSYGNMPHPPLSSRPENNTRTMEFCEMMSSASASSTWTVTQSGASSRIKQRGNFSVASQVTDRRNEEHTARDTLPPRSLMHLCRLKIRSLVQKQRLKHLLLPPPLLRFILHQLQEDLDPESMDSCNYEICI
uniref:SOCS box domain-containing protein n=1 Tax=Knipowitschia caucasica TaxID=637954 RepID=A0AAV2LPX8_KNICA